MPELSDRDRNRIDVCAYATVSTMFAAFCNPKFRGPNFQCTKFTELMVERVPMQIHLSIKVPKYKQKLYEEYAEQSAKAISESLLRESGFLEYGESKD